MDCTFRIIANGNFDKLKQFKNMKMLITVQNDCFYYKDEILDCNDEILSKFDMKKFEPIIWKKDSDEDIVF